MLCCKKDLCTSSQLCSSSVNLSAFICSLTDKWLEGSCAATESCQAFFSLQMWVKLYPNWQMEASFFQNKPVSHSLLPYDVSQGLSPPRDCWDDEWWGWPWYSMLFASIPCPHWKWVQASTRRLVQEMNHILQHPNETLSDRNAWFPLAIPKSGNSWNQDIEKEVVSRISQASRYNDKLNFFEALSCRKVSGRLSNHSKPWSGKIKEMKRLTKIGFAWLGIKKAFLIYRKINRFHFKSNEVAYINNKN